MTFALRILEIFLGLHTLVGAVWKLLNSELNVPSLQAIGHFGWIALSVLEVFCGLALILPLQNKKLTPVAPLAAAFIAGEMLLFSAIHLSSGVSNFAPVFYWLVVAVLAAIVVYGRLRKPAGTV